MGENLEPRYLTFPEDYGKPGGVKGDRKPLENDGTREISIWWPNSVEMLPQPRSLESTHLLWSAHLLGKR